MIDLKMIWLCRFLCQNRFFCGEIQKAIRSHQVYGGADDPSDAAGDGHDLDQRQADEPRRQQLHLRRTADSFR